MWRGYLRGIAERAEQKRRTKMKKLMFAMGVAALCGAVHAIESANVVGYMDVSDDGNKNPGIGSVFMPIGGGTTYSLGSIVVSGDAADEFMFPGPEYLQELNPNGSAVVGRYTYVSEAYLKDEYEDEWEDYKSLIGWWDRGYVGVDGHRQDNCWHGVSWCAER